MDFVSEWSFYQEWISVTTPCSFLRVTSTEPKCTPPHARTPPPWGDSGTLNLARLSLSPPRPPVPWAMSSRGHRGSLAVQVGWERLLVRVFKLRCRFLPDHTRHICMYRLSWSNCGNSKTEFKKRLLGSLVRWPPCHGLASPLPRPRTHCVLWGQPCVRTLPPLVRSSPFCEFTESCVSLYSGSGLSWMESVPGYPGPFGKKLFPYGKKK